MRQSFAVDDHLFASVVGRWRMKHTHVRRPMRERKVLFLKQTLNGCTIRGGIARRLGPIIRPASHVVDEMEITYLGCVL
jgi:hypothetical protein